MFNSGYSQHYFASLLPYQQKYPISALVAPNDETALRMMTFLHALGAGVPSDISLLSFDNSEVAEVARITSVDFGFGPLAYRAARLFAADIPMNVPRCGIVQTEAFIAERSSVKSLSLGQRKQ
jgi:DNA-binding LacI/PurR family transcriptional regulator